MPHYTEEEIEKMGLSCHIDDRDKTPGSKLYDWELKGVPLRIEIGPKDIENNVVSIATRDGIKKRIARNELEKIKDELAEYDERLYRKAEEFLRQHIYTMEKLEKKEGIIEVPWCGKEECGLKMEEELDMKSLGTPLPGKECDKNCPICGGKATTWLRLAKIY